jgi:guanylate kinase
MLVLSSPSGAGKTTLARRLRDEEPDIAMSISHTTRAKRQGEEDGVDYHFHRPRHLHADARPQRVP